LRQVSHLRLVASASLPVLRQSSVASRPVALVSVERASPEPGVCIEVSDMTGGEEQWRQLREVVGPIIRKLEPAKSASKTSVDTARGLAERR
jgi:hypothetical protein